MTRSATNKSDYVSKVEDLWPMKIWKTFKFNIETLSIVN